MSPLPERRKTAEELAALRESLGIPSLDAPDTAADSGELHDEAGELPTSASLPSPASLDLSEPVRDSGVDASTSPVPGPSDPAAELPTPSERPHRSLRKSGGLAVDQPKGRVARGDVGVIPAKRHSDEELKRLRRNAQLSPAVAELVPKGASGWTLGLGYGVGFLLLALGVVGAISDSVAPFNLPFDWLIRLVRTEAMPMMVFGLFCGAAVVFLGFAGWLVASRPLSRHHAGFLTIIAVLVLVFGTLYCFPELHGA